MWRRARTRIFAHFDTRVQHALDKYMYIKLLHTNIPAHACLRVCRCPRDDALLHAYKHGMQPSANIYTVPLRVEQISAYLKLKMILGSQPSLCKDMR